jgi:hypothetical protein
MKPLTVLLVCAGLFSVPGVFVLQACLPSYAATAPPSAPPEKPISVSGYRTWVRVNPKPHPVISRLALLCRSLTPEENAEIASNPHNDKFVTVYVNKIAQSAMLYQKKPVFPLDSLIVKEKLPGPDSTSPELLTVMRKREKGYSPEAGDWEYLVLDGTGKKIQARGRLENCQSCHQQWKETDYVSRVYFTDTMTSKFR